MSANDASVSALLDYMNTIDKRRRVITMQLKEAESKTAFAAQEHVDLEREAQAIAEEEVQLKNDLNALTEEQRLVQLQLMSESDRVRHCELEEPLISEHLRSQIAAIEESSRAWRGKMQELEELRSAWAGDEVTTGLKTKLAALEAEVAAMRDRRATLEQEILSGEVELARLAEEQARSSLHSCGAAVAADTTCFGNGNGQLGDGVALAAPIVSVNQASIMDVKEAILREEYERAQARAHHSRKSAALQREVDDLSGRADELELWLADVDSSRDYLTSNLEKLHRCLEKNLCITCIAQNVA